VICLRKAAHEFANGMYAEVAFQKGYRIANRIIIDESVGCNKRFSNKSNQYFRDNIKLSLPQIKYNYKKGQSL